MGRLVNNELESMWKEMLCPDLRTILSQYFSWGS